MQILERIMITMNNLILSEFLTNKSPTTMIYVLSNIALLSIYLVMYTYVFWGGA